MKVVHCKKEKFDVYIGRPTFWGNPFSHKNNTLAKFKVKTRKEAVKKYEEYMREKLKNSPSLKRRMIDELDGKVLGCWCKPKECHGDVLIKLINEINKGEL